MGSGIIENTMLGWHTARCEGGVRLAMAVFLIVAQRGLAQAPGVAPPAGEPEISTAEEKATFTSHVNLVLVPVVVRDKLGKVVAGLTKEQFRLFDKGKPQEIERFAVETPRSAPVLSGQPVEPQASQVPSAANEGAAPNAASAIPRRFVGYLFDDVHAEASDLSHAREAAGRHMGSQLHTTDRAAIFTTSGQGTVDFTDDREQLREGLGHLAPHPIAHSPAQQCPDVGYMQADLMVNHNDPQAVNAATTEALICLNLYDPFASPAVQAEERKTAQMHAFTEAQRVLQSGEQEGRLALAALKDAVRRMSAMPGERVLVLVSPGFLTMAEHHTDEYDAIDHALRANVVINALNLRGLFTTNIDASRVVVDSAAERVKQVYLRESDALQDALLAEIAAATGGNYFHNNNDLDEGFRRTSSGPDLFYMLGFQPQNLKMDGTFHGLKVTLEGKPGYSVEARLGYYAPTHLENATETARREIEDAVYSTEEMNDLPVQLHTQFAKGFGDAATITVIARVGLEALKFRKADGRNLDNITVAAALFDRNGKLVTGAVKHIDLRLRDETMQNRLGHGLTVRMAMEAQTGAYLVRLVVRDSEGQMMSAVNGAVEIP